jgi:ubiquinone/menaquinone biosynthesis C-methylase UbiE
MEDTGYPDNYFDVVMSNHVLEHSIDSNTVLKEIYRITKPGGWSVHTIPYMRGVPVPKASDIHKTQISDSQWAHDFFAAGFKSEREYFSWNHNQEEFNIIVRKPE